MKLIIEVELERRPHEDDDEEADATKFTPDEEGALLHSLDELLDDGELQNHINGWLEERASEDEVGAVIRSISAGIDDA